MLEPANTFTSTTHYPYGEGNKVQVYRLPQTSFIVVRDPKKDNIVSVQVQCCDAYRYQREMKIQHTREGGAPIDSTSSYRWTVSAYQHPYHHKLDDWDGYTVSRDVAMRLMERLVDLTLNYRTLLFNESTERLPARCEGFVRFHTALVNGVRPSVRLLP